VVDAPARVQPAAPPLVEVESRRARTLQQLPVLALPIAAVALWTSSLQGINPRAMNDLGLVSVLPWQTWLAFALLSLGFITCWRQADQATWLLVVHVLLLMVMLYGLPTAIIHEPSGPTVFRHAGITESLIRTRVVHPKVDAYFNWPGFFMGLATLVKLSGAPSALTFAAWANVAFNLLYLPPLLLLTRAFTRDPKLVWGTVWVFYVANWIQQDYLAPQAFGYLIYLTIMGLLLTYLRPRGTGPGQAMRFGRRLRAVLRVVRPGEVPPPAVSRRTAAAILAVVVLLYTVIVVSHELTPFIILIDVAALVVLGQCTARGLPLIMAIILVLWMVSAASGYLYGHLAQLVDVLGNINKATSANVTGRISGSEQHLLIVRERLLLSGGLWLLAVLGAIRRFRHHHADHVAAALGLAPLLLFGAQPYGGEMLLRIYFFMLPFAAFFATASLLPGAASGMKAPGSLTAGLRAGAATVAFGLTVAIALGGCVIARYGNERMDYFTTGERAAIRFLYEVARPGSTFAVEKSYLPWQYQGYELHRYVSVEVMLVQAKTPLSPAQALNQIAQALLPGRGHPAGFVILSRSQRAYVETLGGVLSTSYYDQFERLVQQSPKFRLIYSNPDAQIFVRLPEVRHAHSMAVAGHHPRVRGCPHNGDRHRRRCSLANHTRPLVRPPVPRW